jgi:hypothetical protein
MTPEAVLATIQAVASATREMFAFLQTPEGQEVLRKSLKTGPHSRSGSVTLALG